MIDQDIHNDTTLKMALMNFSGIGGIKLENIEEVSRGNSASVFIIRGTDEGDIVCKIDRTRKYIDQGSESRLQKNLIKQEQILEFQEALYKNYESGKEPRVPKPIPFKNGDPFGIIPDNINGTPIPDSLVGRQITFMEYIKNKEIKMKEEKHRPKGRPRFYKEHSYLHNYPPVLVEKILSSVSHLHKHGKEYIKENRFHSYSGDKLPSHKELLDKFNNLGININSPDVDKQIQSWAKKVRDRIRNNMKLDMMEVFLYCNAKKDYGHVNVGTDEFLNELKREKLVDDNVIIAGYKLLVADRVKELMEIPNIGKLLHESYMAVKDYIDKVRALPESITHNDLHPGNLLQTLDNKFAIIDLDGASKNRRINDLMSILTLSADDKTQKALLNGYNSVDRVSSDEFHMMYKANIIWELNRFADVILLINYYVNKISAHVKDSGMEKDKLKDIEKKILDIDDTYLKLPLSFNERILHEIELDKNNSLEKIALDNYAEQLDALSLADQEKISKYDYLKEVSKKEPKRFLEKLDRERKLDISRLDKEKISGSDYLEEVRRNKSNRFSEIIKEEELDINRLDLEKMAKEQNKHSANRPKQKSLNGHYYQEKKDEFQLTDALDLDYKGNRSISAYKEKAREEALDSHERRLLNERRAGTKGLTRTGIWRL